ncbi:MAG: type II toxin-antitoxin system RatA family toxin [Coxiella-like endosymbiont]|uniref:type II toxin-antitoxin system RatA family toxin n=1 Tax=Coxiella-like endosymbiont TaxID=1592897 RepID=UPI00215B273A|nr:type II toxin-antitoxin system RatA family toxin [Coxiella-like endosymbiont]UVE59628.1 type II toxin-antitoxin system RatA family toxin [Coxiella-like endosymbiont]
MPNINKTKTVFYSEKQMYELVNDVASYSKFVPFCSNSQIDNHTPDEIRATLSFSRGVLHKSFTTLNRLQPHKMIEIRLINGPFKQLRGFWQFESLVGHNQCRVSLDLEFEFTSRWFTLMFGPLFSEVVIMLVDSFCKRADTIYGEKNDLY